MYGQDEAKMRAWVKASQDIPKRRQQEVIQYLLGRSDEALKAFLGYNDVQRLKYLQNNMPQTIREWWLVLCGG
jgi:hypothetical protein